MILSPAQILFVMMIVSACFFGVIVLLTFIGLTRRTESIGTNPSGEATPMVSIVVPARNEANTIPRCLDGLRRLDYPPEKFEILLVNDHSDDGTEEIMKQFASEVPNAKVLSIGLIPGQATGYSAALAAGANAAKGKYILITDADCEVSPGWIKAMLSALAGTAVAGGFLVLARRTEKSLTARVQSLDWMLFAAAGAAWANLGRPISVFGNNMGIERDIYSKAGGFENAGPHMTEDFALFRKVMKIPGTRARLSLDPDAMAYTRPVHSLGDFYRQRKRWALGSKDRGTVSWLLMISTFLMHVSIVLSILTGHFTAAAAGFVYACAMNALVLETVCTRLKRKDLLWSLIPFQAYFIAYTLFFASVMLFSRKVVWKDRKYVVKIEER
jgi:cellulose synthase/poly-beta-1,6-N-acetylglucosamine synthase-like glycosyltransferase